ncbi:MAG TPA: acyl carrier protein [Prosthecobacter sp.]|jgi:acyl carrier protein|nr:acyl carrier protein [Prosthecobacter sp.]
MSHEERLINCFKNVFPELRDDEVRRATSHSVADWDSVAMVTLVTLVDEEFGLQMPPENFEEMMSFELFLVWIQENLHDA